MANKLVGQNYSTPDLVAKVTGRAKYAEDFRADGMLFAKLLLSPRPHARVTRIDASAALAMPGVKAILTADDLPAVVEGANLGEGIIASSMSERGLTMEPLYVGEPILAVAAVDELTAADAIDRIHVEYESLPFVGRSARIAAARQPERANARQRVGAAPARTSSAWTSAHTGAAAGAGVEVDRGGLCRGGRRQAAAGQGDRRVEGGRCGGRPRAGRPGARRNLRRREHEPSAARNAERDGLLAERQALHALLDAEHHADDQRRGAVGRGRAEGRGDHQRVHGRRVRQQGIRVRVRGHSGAARRRKPARPS